MPTPLKCPNCGGNVRNHPKNDCLLAVLIQVIRERKSLSEKKLLAIHSTVDVDAFWDDLGPIIDNLETGFYSE